MVRSTSLSLSAPFVILTGRHDCAENALRKVSGVRLIGNQKLLETSASLLVTSALLVVTRTLVTSASLLVTSASLLVSSALLVVIRSCFKQVQRF